MSYIPKNADRIARMVAELTQRESVPIQGKTVEELRVNLLRDIWGLDEVSNVIEESNDRYYKKFCRLEYLPFSRQIVPITSMVLIKKTC